MRRDAGFTLIEVLTALVVLGFVVAGLSQGLQFGLSAVGRQARVSAGQGDLDAVDRLLRRLIEQMEPGTARAPAAPLGTAGGFAFTTDLGAAAAALSDTAAEVAITVQSERLVLRWRPAEHAIALTAPPPPGEAVVLDGIERIEFAYFGPTGEQPPAWHATWQQRTLPSLVRMRLVFPAGSGRRWPDIVAAPARSMLPS